MSNAAKKFSRNDFRNARRFSTTSAIHRRDLVEEHADLVRVVARQISRRHNIHRSSMDEDDLFSVGILGLLEADTRFDKEVGTPFSSFAEFRIKGAMIDELRRKDVMPRRLRSKASRLAKTRRQLEHDLGRAPTPDELSEEMEISVADLSRLEDRIDSFRFQSADHGLPIASRERSPFHEMVEKQQSKLLAETIDQLDERLQLVLDLYFRQELTLREIGEILDVTEGRVSQLKSQAIRELREQLSHLS